MYGPADKEAWLMDDVTSRRLDLARRAVGVLQDVVRPSVA